MKLMDIKKLWNEAIVAPPSKSPKWTAEEVEEFSKRLKELTARIDAAEKAKPSRLTATSRFLGGQELKGFQALIGSFNHMSLFGTTTVYLNGTSSGCRHTFRFDRDNQAESLAQILKEFLEGECAG